MLIVTIAALLMSASLGWFAYRLLQEERRRSEARVALLTAALDADPPAARASDEWHGPWPGPSGATPVASHAPLPHIVMLEDDARSMRAFASERTAPHTPLPTTPAADADVLRPSHASLPDAGPQIELRTAGLFADVPGARPADRRGLVAVATVALVALLAIAYAFFGRASTSGPDVTAPAAAVSATAVPASGAAGAVKGGVPLDLLSLTHQQQGSSLVVRGIVRNPVAGSDRASVLASVVLLDQTGELLGNGRAAISVSRLAPGGDAGFAVEVPSHKDVRRYRVTFRAADGTPIPHADKRSERP